VPSLPPGSLVLEHAGLAPPEQRARAIKMGIQVTVQQPLLHALAFGLIQGWGTKGTAEVFPLGEWIAESALRGVGSDCPDGFRLGNGETFRSSRKRATELHEVHHLCFAVRTVPRPRQADAPFVETRKQLVPLSVFGDVKSEDRLRKPGSTEDRDS
jgi:hypothetical protein